ncbi:MAG: hypothetical protein ACRCZF_21050 [Gemmataceae bacterium]
MPRIPLHHEPHFTFRFAEDRLIPRFHLPGMVAGATVQVWAWNPISAVRGELLTVAQVGAEGWVDLTTPLIVRAGEGFVVVPVPISAEGTIAAG